MECHSLFTIIKIHLHTTFACKDTVFQSKKFIFWLKLAKRGGGQNLHLKLAKNHWIFQLWTKIEIWCPSVIFYKFIGFEKGWQKGWQLWIAKTAHTSKLVKSIQFQIFFAYIEWAVPATPFECLPFCILYIHIRKREGKRGDYLFKSLKIIKYRSNHTNLLPTNRIYEFEKKKIYLHHW